MDRRFIAGRRRRSGKNLARQREMMKKKLTAENVE
jgi:hypothetical protein